MNFLTKIIAFLALSLLFVGMCHAQKSATASASVHIINPISISKSLDMDFGNIATNGNSGYVTLASNSGTAVRTTSGDITLPTTSGTVTTAAFMVSGEGNYTYAITLPSDHTLTHTTNSSNQLILSNFTSYPNQTGTLSGSGEQEVFVGATLNVESGTAEGIYTSASGFNVTVNYN